MTPRHPPADTRKFTARALSARARPSRKTSLPVRACPESYCKDWVCWSLPK